jgi:hypothetical protein
MPAKIVLLTGNMTDDLFKPAVYRICLDDIGFGATLAAEDLSGHGRLNSFP